jgi:hypothetical protein
MAKKHLKAIKIDDIPESVRIRIADTILKTQPFMLELLIKYFILEDILPIITNTVKKYIGYSSMESISQIETMNYTKHYFYHKKTKLFLTMEYFKNILDFSEKILITFRLNSMEKSLAFYENDLTKPNLEIESYIENEISKALKELGLSNQSEKGE